MLIVRAIQTGYSGGPGYTDFHFGNPGGDVNALQAEADDAVAKTKQFWAAIKEFFPLSWTVFVDPTVREVSKTTGVLQELWTTANPGVYSGTGGSAYAAPAGGLINWATRTPGAHGFMRGRTFLVPLASVNYGSDGKIGAGPPLTVNTAAALLMTPLSGGQVLVVWKRPKNLLGGTFGPVTSGVMSPLVAVLTSRRR